MPPILLKLIMNKYVIIGMVALSLFGYIKYLNTSLSKAREDAQSYAAIAKEQTLLVEARDKAYAQQTKAVEALQKQKDKVVVKVEERVKQIVKLEKVYVVKDGACQLDDTTFGLLSDSYNEANGGNPTK